MALQLPQEEGSTAGQTPCASGVAAPISALLGGMFSSHMSSSSGVCSCCPSYDVQVVKTDVQVIKTELSIINMNCLTVI